MNSAEIIITNAAVYTVDATNPTAEAVAVVGNKIAVVGKNEEALALRGANTRVVDGAGRTLMPGINDSHFHLLMGAKMLDHLDLSAVTSLDELAGMIAQADEGLLWIQGGGLTYDVTGDGTPLTRHHLDAIEPNRPMQLASVDQHTIWANTKALEIAGVLKDAQARDGAEIVMAEDGTATGQVNEDRDVIGQHIPELSSAEIRALIKRTIAQLNAMGITSVTNMFGSAEQMALYADLAASDDFNLRITVPYLLSPDAQVGSIISEVLPLRTRYQSGKVRAGSVKLFIDGVVESGTAFMLEPYTRWPESVGAPLIEWDHYRKLIVEADKHRLQVKVHAIGDAGIRMTLDAYEAARQGNGKRDSRHRIEHVEVLHNDDLPRFKTLDVIAAMQPLHASRPGSDHYINWMHCVGESRYHRAFRWRELRDQGTELPLGSDWPVVTFDPWIGMDAALTQRAWGDGMVNNQQTLAEVIDGYTRAGAYAEFQDDVKGQVKVGMLADLVLLDCDIFALDESEIVNVRPVMTICDGDVVFERGK